MDYKLKGKKAFITGSTSGIGLAIAKTLCAEGADVIINGRDEKRLDEVTTTLRSEFPAVSVSGIAVDFAHTGAVANLSDQLEAVDILINNVGVFTSQSFEETSDEDWYRLFEVNVMSGVRLSRALMPGMLRKCWGRIVFISSECAQLVPNDLIAYSTTKAALHAVARGLAQLTKGTEVTVNTVMPGSTLSEGAERFLQGQAERENTTPYQVAANFFNNVRTSSLIQRFIRTDEVATAVAYLVSPVASSINGSVLKVDGGSVGGIF